LHLSNSMPAAQEVRWSKAHAEDRTATRLGLSPWPAWAGVPDQPASHTGRFRNGAFPPPTRGEILWRREKPGQAADTAATRTS